METSSRRSRSREIIGECLELGEDHLKDYLKRMKKAYKKAIHKVDVEKIEAPFKFESFSPKQKLVLNWWKSKKYQWKDGIVADGSVRSGKTMSFSLSFVTWAMTTFNKKKFAIAGQSITSTMENIINDLVSMLNSLKYRKDKQAMRVKSAEVKKNKLIVHAYINGKLRCNSFEIVGGRDESSYKLIQGRTYAGAMVDEVVLQPESFVNQLKTRCSVKGRRFWYTCNPEGPLHWFKVKYINKLKELRLIRIHFNLDDNPSLDESIKEGYRRMFEGVFYQRYILGLWTVAEGLVYGVFSKVKNLIEQSLVPRNIGGQWLAIDYGSSNPTRVGLYNIIRGKFRDEIYKHDEYSHDARKAKKDKSDSQYVEDILKFIRYYGREPRQIKGVIIDPSAKSLIIALREAGFNVISGINDVIPGIRKVIEAFYKGVLKITTECEYTLDELAQYSWDAKAAQRGEDKPIKEYDHSLDETRYLIYTLWSKGIISI